MTNANSVMQLSIMYGRLLKIVAINHPIFVPCSPIFSLARASIQRSKGVVDFASSKTTNGRSPIFPYSCLCLSVSGAGGGERIFVAGDGDVLGGEELGEGDSCNNASNCSRAAGGKSPFFKSASSSARSFGLSFPGWRRRSL